MCRAGSISPVYLVMGKQYLGVWQASSTSFCPRPAQGHCPSRRCYCLEPITATQLPAGRVHAISVKCLCPARDDLVLMQKEMTNLVLPGQRKRHDNSCSGDRGSLPGPFQDRGLAGCPSSPGAGPGLGRCSDVCVALVRNRDGDRSLPALTHLSSCLAV